VVKVVALAQTVYRVLMVHSEHLVNQAKADRLVQMVVVVIMVPMGLQV
jgi:hypothetical protein